MVGSIIPASEVSLLLLVPTPTAPNQIKCAKDILRYPLPRLELDYAIVYVVRPILRSEQIAHK
jgi:hypothetical protein